jgi:hypothetical protein
MPVAGIAPSVIDGVHVMGADVDGVVAGSAPYGIRGDGVQDGAAFR